RPLLDRRVVLRRAALGGEAEALVRDAHLLQEQLAQRSLLHRLHRQPALVDARLREAKDGLPVRRGVEIVLRSHVGELEVDRLVRHAARAGVEGVLAAQRLHLESRREDVELADDLDGLRVVTFGDHLRFEHVVREELVAPLGSAEGLVDLVDGCVELGDELDVPGIALLLHALGDDLFRRAADRLFDPVLLVEHVGPAGCYEQDDESDECLHAAVSSPPPPASYSLPGGTAEAAAPRFARARAAAVLFWTRADRLVVQPAPGGPENMHLRATWTTLSLALSLAVAGPHAARGADCPP